MKTVIIGGVAAGMSAASKLKRLAPSDRVVVIEKGGETSYGACGLPYYVSGVNEREDLLRIRKPEEFRAAGIDLNMRCEARGVDFERRLVRCADLVSGEAFEETYDQLVIATGARPIVPDWFGRELKNIFTLKTIEDANRIRAAAAGRSGRAVVIGGGYIGLEMVESFLHMGYTVDVVEMADRVLTTFDPEFSEEVRLYLETLGVRFHLGEAVTGFEGDLAVDTVVTSKARYAADIVLIAVGVRPNTAFLEGGVQTLPNGAVLVDERMAASREGVWAAGDCACVWHRVLRKQVYLPLATNANKQGRYLAENILGANHAYVTALGTAVMKIGDLELGRTGVSGEEAAANGIACVAASVEGRDRAPYYPGGAPLKVKLLCRADTGEVIGAQLLGRHGVALRTDVMAACITAGMSAKEVGELDLGYAPPYAMPWDVLHIAANVAEAKLPGPKARQNG